MASIEQRGKRWLVRWRDPDGTQRARSCRTREAARALQREVEDCVAAGRRWEPRDARATPGLREVAEQWLIAQARLLAPSSLVAYGIQVETFVRWAERRTPRAPVTVLSVRLLEEYWDYVSASGSRGRTRGVGTARRYVEIIQQLWSWAAGREDLVGVPPPRRMDMPRPPPPRAAVAPTWEEMDRAILACEGRQRALAIVMRCTGLRVQQVMRLRWEDLQGDTLVIRPELGKTRAERSGRVMPVSPVLLEELRVGRLVQWPGGEWLVGWPTTRRKARSVSMEQAWRAAGVRAVAWEGSPHHAFRRGFISGLRSAGADWQAVEYLVGHQLVGVQAPYVDPHVALPLRAAVALVPALPARAP